MSDIKYTSIDFSKYEYSLPEEIREFAKNPKPKNKFKELLSSLVPQGVSDVFDKTLDVGKTALGVGSSIDKGKAKQDKLDKANKKVDYKKLSTFFKNGFTNYKEQYDLHPVIYEYKEEQSKNNKISYMMVSMATGDTVTLQPYKLANTELYKIAKQKSHGTKIGGVLDFIGLKSYVRAKYKNIQVSNISTDTNPLSDFKFAQTMTAPIYKLLNKFNPELETKYSCEFVFYDDKKRELEWVKNVFIEQVTQNRIVLSRYIEGKEGKKSQSKVQINLSLIIPTFANELEKKESGSILYEPIFSRLEEKGESKKDLKNKKLVLFYVRPFLYIEDSPQEQTSFTARIDTFDFSIYLGSGLYGDLKSLITGDRFGGDEGRIERPPKDREKFLAKLKLFIEKYKDTDLLIYGYDELIERFLRLGENTIQNNSLSIFKEEESISKSDVFAITNINQLNKCHFIFKCKYISEDDKKYIFEIKERVRDEENKEYRNQITTQAMQSKKIIILKSEILEVFDNGKYPFMIVKPKVFGSNTKPQSQEQQSGNQGQQNPNIPDVVEIPDTIETEPKLNTTTVEGINEIIQKVKAEFNTSPNFIVDIAQYVTKLRDKNQTIDANTSKKLQLCIDLVSSVGKEINIRFLKNTITNSKIFTNSIVSSPSLEEFNNNYTEGSSIKSKIKNVEIKDKLNKIELELDTLEVKDIFGIGVLDNKIQLYVSSNLNLINTEVENLLNNLDFNDSPNLPPQDTTTTPESLQQTIQDIAQGNEELLTQEEFDELLGGNEQEREEVIQEINNIEDETEKKKLKLLSMLSEIALFRGEVDIIEVNDSIEENSFQNAIVNATSMDELSQYVYKKYSGRLEKFEVENLTLNLSNIKEIDLSTIPAQSQESSAQQSNTQENTNVPNISNAEGEVKYYKTINEDFNKSEEVESDNKRNFFEMWKQGNNYYVRVNPNNQNHKSLIERDDSYLKSYFEYKSDLSATKIRNIKPVVYDVTSGSLTQKGVIELS